MNPTTERPARPAGLLESGLAAQNRQRLTTLRDLARLRREAAAEIERLINFLDESDDYSQSELEEQVDDGPIDDTELEPSFCGVTAGDRAPNLASTLGDELEADYGNGQEADHEPSLGSVAVGENVTQAQWAQGGADDAEDEHDGAEPDVDEESVDDDREPSLGWSVDGDLGVPTNEPDREDGEPARSPQNRTNIDGISVDQDAFRRRPGLPLTGLTERQRKLLRSKRGRTGLCD